MAGLKSIGLTPQCISCKDLMNYVNRIYVFYKKHKISVHKIAFCKRKNHPIFTLHKEIDVRWTPSTFKALITIFVYWPIIVEHLHELSRYPDDPDIRLQAKKHLRVFTDKNFLAVLALGKKLILL